MENPLKPQELSTLTLTSVTSSKSSLGEYEVLLTRYFFFSNMAFSMLLLLKFTVPSVIAFVCLFQATLEIGWVIFSILVNFLPALCPWPTKRHIKTNDWFQKIDHLCLPCWPSCLSWTSDISHFDKLFLKSKPNQAICHYLPLPGLDYCRISKEWRH